MTESAFTAGPAPVLFDAVSRAFALPARPRCIRVRSWEKKDCFFTCGLCGGELGGSLIFSSLGIFPGIVPTRPSVICFSKRVTKAPFLARGVCGGESGGDGGGDGGDGDDGGELAGAKTFSMLSRRRLKPAAALVLREEKNTPELGHVLVQLVLEGLVKDDVAQLVQDTHVEHAQPHNHLAGLRPTAQRHVRENTRSLS